MANEWANRNMVGPGDMVRNLQLELLPFVTFLIGSGTWLIYATAYILVSWMPPSHFVLAALVMLVSLSSRWLGRMSLALGSFALLFGLFGVDLLATLAFRVPFAPYLLSVLVLIALPLCGMASAMGVAAVGTVFLAAVSRQVGEEWGDLTLPIAMIWLSLGASWLTYQRFDTVVKWAWSSFQEARRGLEETQAHRAELAKLYKELDEAYYRLDRLNHELIRARDEAEAARRAKAQFAANISHELRTPINLIVGFTELMLTAPETYGGSSLPSAYLSDLNAVYRSARHLQGLIEDVLDLSQLEAKRMAIVKERTDLTELIREAVEIARPLIERKKLTLNVILPADLPCLTLDRLRIRQVILNLLNNAVRFTDSGTITVRATVASEQVVVSVADTGIGILPTEMPHIFKEFQRLERPPTQRPGGVGLGLALSKQFILLHDGRIWAESEGIPGKGSIFAFALPLEPDMTPKPSHLHKTSIEHMESAGRVRLAVMTSDRAVARLFQRHITGCQILSATDWEELTCLVEQARPQAVIADLAEVGPDWDSLQKCQADLSARLSGTDIPLIACSFPSGRKAGLALGAAEYLVKPITREVLLTAIERVNPSARRILLVDDDRDMVRMMTRMLKTTSRRYDVNHAYGGYGALQRMQDSRPDLVVLDLLMPDMDGFAVLQYMQAQEELMCIPVIVVTAKGYVEAITPSPLGRLALIQREGFNAEELLRYVQAIADAQGPLR